MNEIDTDVEANINLSFIDAALGCKKTIRYRRNVNCGTCNGSGSAKGSSISVCSNCKGSGQVYLYSYNFVIIVYFRTQKFEMGSYFPNPVLIVQVLVKLI
jgi:DnaJ-class molecular chaperone